MKQFKYESEDEIKELFARTKKCSHKNIDYSDKFVSVYVWESSGHDSRRIKVNMCICKDCGKMEFATDFRYDDLKGERWGM
jgi:hypothetical protein